jgi:hypothetical protein
MTNENTTALGAAETLLADGTATTVPPRSAPI